MGASFFSLLAFFFLYVVGLFSPYGGPFLRLPLPPTLQKFMLTPLHISKYKYNRGVVYYYTIFYDILCVLKGQVFRILFERSQTQLTPPNKCLLFVSIHHVVLMESDFVIAAVSLNKYHKNCMYKHT